MTNKPGLQKDALGLVNAAAIGIAGTAPAFTISATLGILIGTTGPLAPASLLYCGVVMFGITFAYVHLNRVQTNAGTSYAWVSRVFNPALGFMAGWTVLVSSVLFLVSATIPAANATLLLLAPDLVNDRVVVSAVAAGWLIAVSAVTMRGIAITGLLQSVMTAVEISILFALVAAGAASDGGSAAHALAWSGFSPARFDAASFSAGAVIALYFFWGWEVSLNLNEETRDGARAPGLAAVVAMAVVMAVFIAFTIITPMVLSEADITASGTNVLFAVADRVLPRPWSYAAVLAVILSTVGTLEASTLQFSRTLFAASRDRMLHPRWALIHPRWKTPYAANLLLAGLGIALLAFSLAFASVETVLKASVNALGIQAACYYGLAGFACAWHFRKQAAGSLYTLVFMVAWPAASAAALWIVVALTMSGLDAATVAIGLGGILVGLVPLAIHYRRRVRVE